MKWKYPKIGEIVDLKDHEGDEDTVFDLLVDRLSEVEKGMAKKYRRQWLQAGEDEDLREEIMEGVYEGLRDIEPPFCTFHKKGTVWQYSPTVDLVSDAVDDGDAVVVKDTSEVKKSFIGYVIHQNDHGNLTCYYHNSRARPPMQEIWSCV